MKQGDIILAPFPFSDSQTLKVRPCIIISNDAYNAKTDDLVVCAITGNLLTHAYAVILDHSDIHDGVLHERSCVKVDAIAKIHKRRALKTIGTVNQGAFDKIVTVLGRLVSRT